MRETMVGLVWVMVTLAATAHVVDADEADLYAKLCADCHVTQGPPTVAPPIFAVKAHVLQTHPEREAFVDYLVQWVEAPDANRTLMPGAVRRFGVMPRLGYDPADVRMIAEFLFDTPLHEPAWFRSHYQAEHGRPPER